MHRDRLAAVLRAIRETGARRVADLGCGDGDLLVMLAAEPGIDRVHGLDPAPDALGRLRSRLGALPGKSAEVTLAQGSVLDPGLRLPPLECAVLVEVIEHLDPGRLSRMERAVFAGLAPDAVIVTTPNADFNALLGVPPHRFRHPDHRFEWDRPRFRRWAGDAGAKWAYTVACRDIAGCHPVLGGASQMAVFRRNRPETGN